MKLSDFLYKCNPVLNEEGLFFESTLHTLKEGVFCQEMIKYNSVRGCMQFILFIFATEPPSKLSFVVEVS